VDEAENVFVSRHRERLAGGQTDHDKMLWAACREAAQRAGITKRVYPHLLRHSYATHLLEDGADLPTLQALLGHADLKPTSIYLHLSERHLKAAGTPLDKVKLSSPDRVKRSRKAA
jgi:integrase/recombinase XerD